MSLWISQITFIPENHNALPVDSFSGLPPSRWDKLRQDITKETSRKSAQGNTKSIKIFWCEALKATGFLGLDLTLKEMEAIEDHISGLRYPFQKVGESLALKGYIERNEYKAYQPTEKLHAFLVWYKEHGNDLVAITLPTKHGTEFKLTFLGCLTVIKNLRLSKMM